MNTPKSKSGKPRILIFEDSLLASTQLTLLLSAWGYEISGAAQSGQYATKLVEESQPDLLILDDILLGPLSGLETALVIFARSVIPVIFLSNDNRRAVFQPILEQYPARVVTKPFTDGLLLKSIEQLLGERSR